MADCFVKQTNKRMIEQTDRNTYRLTVKMEKRNKSDTQTKKTSNVMARRHMADFIDNAKLIQRNVLSRKML